MTDTNWNEMNAKLLYHFILAIASMLSRFPSDRWEWQVTPSAPSARMLGEHCYSWLVCDRQHIAEPDAQKHADIPLPLHQQELCSLLQAEAQTWRTLIENLSPEELVQPRLQFGGGSMTVMGFTGHILQNTIYKCGQISTLYFALGLDGEETYAAPMPNPIYAHMRAGTLDELQ